MMYILFSVYYCLQQKNYLNKKIIKKLINVFFSRPKKKIISIAYFRILNGHIIFYFLKNIIMNINVSFNSD